MDRFTNGELEALIYVAENTPARTPQEDRALVEALKKLYQQREAQR